MNRLLLEHYYGEAIRKGINNTEVQKYYLLSFIASEKAKQKLENENVNVINCIEIDEAAEVFQKFQWYLEIIKRKNCSVKICVNTMGRN